jgi:mono/diheme cytochrome c family protein
LAAALGTWALAGCADTFNAGPITYVKSEKQAADLKGKPRLQAAVNKALANLYGPNPRQIKVPPGLDLPDHGKHLANYFVPVSAPNTSPKHLYYTDSKSGKPVFIEGGYALYRRHCLHCHGVSGDGKGPTADFLWPRPRDFRPGKFKFTSTTTDKPTRDDLRKTVAHGIPNSAMPAFEALMTTQEMEQVIDYVIFLSVRGQSEINLVNAASLAEDNEADTALSDDAVKEAVQVVFDAWRDAEGQVLNPPTPRKQSTRKSILNGRSLFLGQQTAKGLQCVGCHGEKGDGNGKSFVDVKVFNYVTFGGDPDKLQERLNTYDEKTRALWNEGSKDDWGNPLRPANLNLGIYKGGRRPLDLYWRIAKGINGAKMPAHQSILSPEEIWDLVNFVLALPYEPGLLEGVKPPPTPPAPARAVARR